MSINTSNISPQHENNFIKELRDFIKLLRSYLRNQFDLSDDDAEEQELKETFRKNSSLRGTNLWVLMFAIFIASVGLNINSTAVIIGAMLISPLMGPIMGIGFGAATTDFLLIRSSFRSLSFAVTTAVLTSTLYFYLSPLRAAHSELIARTVPTFYDVLIAFFGGLAVSIAFTRKNKTANVIAGASIATALMPPLCTAGYGLAHGSMSFFLGALYLFVINGIYICLATFLVIRMLGLKKTGQESQNLEYKMKWFMAVTSILTLLPSIYIAYGLVQTEMLQAKIDNFIRSEVLVREVQILQQTLDYHDNKPVLKLVLLGDKKKTIEQEIRNRLKNYGLAHVELKIEDTLTQNPVLDLSVIKTGVIEDLFAKNERLLKLKEEEIKHLHQRIANLEATHIAEEDILKELLVEHPSVKNITLLAKKLDDTKQELVGYIESQKTLLPKEQNNIKNWLQIRTKSQHVNIFFKALKLASSSKISRS